MLDLLTIGTLFVLSVIACWVGGEVVRRKGIQIDRRILLAFHLLYGVGFVGAILFL
ncbi:MAG: hypothetical protein ACW98Y_10255 [Candidatus Thorarchaeota archaeon]